MLPRLSWRPLALVGPLCLAVMLCVPAAAQAPVAAPSGRRVIAEDDLRRWLTDLSSDQMQGRAVFTEGYGMASAYIAAELRALGVTPMGDHGSFLQSFSKSTYRVDRKSTLTVSVGGESKTFAHGDHVTFAVEAGAKQTLTFHGVEFAGAGPDADGQVLAKLGRAVDGKLVVYMPPTVGGRDRNRAPSTQARSEHLIAVGHAAGAIALEPPASDGGRGAARGDRGAGGGGAADRGTAAGGSGAATTTLSTVLRIDQRRAPALTADDTVFAFLLEKAPVPFEELRARADRGDDLPMFTVPDVTVTIAIDNTYEPTNVEYTQNVVGMVEGTDPVLKQTYVFFGAHLDHVGYATGSQAKGRANTPVDQDRIWNGADDDGSGSTALLAIAKAFMAGPRPRRSLIFVWHAGEEEGLLGSEYMAANPVVPLDSIQAELNIDMIGRNRDDDARQHNTLYLIGADRISTDLHNLLVDVNASEAPPLSLDFEFNDASDPNRFYVRSDHYSYASRGIPIAFFFTGTHPDYHANTDTVDKILFPKMRRIVQFIYDAGFAIAERTSPLVRDNRGPRSGKGFSGRLD